MQNKKNENIICNIFKHNRNKCRHILECNNISKYSKIKDPKVFISTYWKDQNIKFYYNTRVLYYNLYYYLKKLGVISNIITVKKIFMILCNDYKVKISNQQYFTIQFIEDIKKIKKLQFLFEDGFSKYDFVEEIQTETITGYRPRIDLLFQINENTKIAIEFLEKHHEKEYINWNDNRLKREASIFLRVDNPIKHIMYIGDIKWNSDRLYKKKVIKHFKTKVLKLKDINNKKKYFIGQMELYNINKKYAEFLYDAYHNKNDYIISIDELNDLLKIKKTEEKNVLKKFIEDLPEDNDIEDDFSDLDSDCEEEKEIKKKLYINNNRLTNHGLVRYLHVLEKKHMQSDKDYESQFNLTDNVNNAIVHSIERIRENSENIQKTFSWGIDIAF